MRKINDPCREPLREKQFVPLPKHHLNLSPFPTKDNFTVPGVMLVNVKEGQRGYGVYTSDNLRPFLSLILASDLTYCS